MLLSLCLEYNYTISLFILLPTLKEEEGTCRSLHNQFILSYQDAAYPVYRQLHFHYFNCPGVCSR